MPRSHTEEVPRAERREEQVFSFFLPFLWRGGLSFVRLKGETSRLMREKNFRKNKVFHKTCADARVRRSVGSRQCYVCTQSFLIVFFFFFFSFSLQKNTLQNK